MHQLVELAITLIARAVVGGVFYVSSSMNEVRQPLCDPPSTDRARHHIYRPRVHTLLPGCVFGCVENVRPETRVPFEDETLPLRKERSETGLIRGASLIGLSPELLAKSVSFVHLCLLHHYTPSLGLVFD